MTPYRLHGKGGLILLALVAGLALHGGISSGGSASASSSSSSSSGGYGTPPASFQACVIRVESSGRAWVVNSSSGAGGLYQFLPSTWAETPYGSQYPGGAQTAPASVQTEAFDWEYNKYGPNPWRPYDGC